MSESHANGELSGLLEELKAVADSEMWQAGAVVRFLRPERAHKTV